MFEISLTTEEKINVQLSPKTADGSPAVVDGAISWSVTGDCTVITSDSDGGKSAEIISGETATTSLITITADADMGDGVRSIVQEITVHVTYPEATDLGVVFGEPMPK